MAFQNKDINEKIKILNETLFSIFHDFIPKKISKFDYKKPIWMNNEITLLLKKRLKLSKKYYNAPTDLNKSLMINTVNECTRLNKKISSDWVLNLRILAQPPKTCWSILNRFLSNKKIPIMLPILVSDKVILIFVEKSKLFNSYLPSQCTPVINKNQLSSLNKQKDGKNNSY